MTHLTLSIDTPIMENKLRSLLKELVGIQIVSRKSDIEENGDSTVNFLSAFAGAWHGKETADQIISNIRENHVCKPPVDFD